jgi:cell division septal protein FtsQ
VKDATVARIWPAGLRVIIAERTPIAFVQLPYGPRQSSRMMLIDEDGVLLDPPPHRFSLPVLLGIRPQEELPLRLRKVQRMLRLEAAIGGEMHALSEIDVGDPHNLVVTRRMDDGLVTIRLGDGNYAARLRNFFAHYDDLHARLPRSRAFDLRVDGRITALPEDANAQ